MSVNVKTPNGLLEIGGKVTKEKVISALGYSPANEEVETTINNHIKDTDIHITPEERESWNNKSKFSGDFNDLENSPIQENESGDFILADKAGNVIMKVDAEGMHSTEAELSGIKVRETLVEHNNHIADTDKHITAEERNSWNNKSDFSGSFNDLTDIPSTIGDIASHTGDANIHISTEERTKWNNKSDFSGDFNDLKNAPDIQENESGEVVYADEAGNIIAKIDSNGLETTKVTADEVIVGGTNVETKLNNLDSTINTHKKDSDIHITAEERTSWNNKSEFSGSFNDLTDIPSTIGDIASHTGNEDIHVTAAEKAVWTNKSDFSGDFNDLKNAPDIKEDETGELVYADMSGNVIVKVNKDGLETTHVAVDAIVLKDAINGNIYMLQMQNGKLVSFSIALSIQITVPPAKSLYSEGEEFDPAGMVVSAICEDGSIREIINYTYSIDNDIVTIVYREWKSIHTTTYEIVRYAIEDLLVDFEYNTNGDYTYTLTNWKETLNGESSTEMVIPDFESIIL